MKNFAGKASSYAARTPEVTGEPQTRRGPREPSRPGREHRRDLGRVVGKEFQDGTHGPFSRCVAASHTCS